jgi:hypothetical protein
MIRHPAIRQMVRHTMGQRSLYFDNIDMQALEMSGRCTCCGQEFRAEPRLGERVDDVLLRIRADFEAHACRV